MITRRWLGLALAVVVAAPLSAKAARVHVATISGGINPAVADYLEKAIAQCAAENGSALVLELDTPGGLLFATKDIVTDILNAPVPVIVFVSPRGAYAASAGAFITLAGHVAAMAPGTSIGAAHPVGIGPTPAPPPEPRPGGDDDEAAKAPRPTDIQGEKVENWAAAFIESIAEARDRNVEWAADAVRKSVAITQKEAVELNVVDLVAEDLSHLLELVDGRVVTVGREEVKLETKGAEIVRIPMGAVNRFFDVISHPQIALLLMLAGLGGLYLEFSQPGLIVPAVIGVVCLILAGLAFQIIPFNWIGLILIVAGFALMGAEIFVSSFGLLFAAGVVCLGLGGYMIFDVPELGGLRVPFFQVILPAVAALAIFGAIIVFGVSRSFLRPQFSGSEGLLGATAVVDSDLNPSGRVFLHGEYWTAEAAEPIVRGERVKILEVRDLVLRVARVVDPGEGTS